MIDMVTEEQGQKLISIARKKIETVVKEGEDISIEEEDYMKDEKGVFITLNTSSGNLRACMGLPYPDKSLLDSVLKASELVTQDPRFPPLKEEELDGLEIELTVLTEPEEVGIDSGGDAKEEIEIGRDGLIIKGKYGNGLLLPQVAEDNDWDELEFLNHTCRKAGMKNECWKKEEVDLLRFQGQVFKE